MPRAKSNYRLNQWRERALRKAKSLQDDEEQVISDRMHNYFITSRG